MNWTSFPVTGPSPSVLKLGFGKIPFSTEFAAVNDWVMTDVVNFRVPAEALRSANSTSEGELVRLGTWSEGGVVESNGNTR